MEGLVPNKIGDSEDLAIGQIRLREEGDCESTGTGTGGQWGTLQGSEGSSRGLFHFSIGASRTHAQVVRLDGSCDASGLAF